MHFSQPSLLTVECKLLPPQRARRGRVHLLRLVALVDEPREHVSVVDGKVVPLTVDVGRDHGSEVAAVLLLSYGQSTNKVQELA